MSRRINRVIFATFVYYYKLAHTGKRFSIIRIWYNSRFEVVICCVEKCIPSERWGNLSYAGTERAVWWILCDDKKSCWMKKIHLIQSCRNLKIFWHFVISKGLCLQLPSRTAKHNRCRVDMQKQRSELTSRLEWNFITFILLLRNT